jgi:hypothetical protein
MQAFGHKGFGLTFGTLLNIEYLVFQSDLTSAILDMLSDRRTFFLKGLSATGAVLCAESIGTAFASPRRGPLMTPGNRQVLDFVSRYAVELNVGGVTADGGLKVLARVGDLDALSAALSGMPFTRVFAAGNQLNFHHAGGSYAVENLLSTEYQSRLAQ